MWSGTITAPHSRGLRLGTVDEPTDNANTHDTDASQCRNQAQRIANDEMQHGTTDVSRERRHDFTSLLQQGTKSYSFHDLPPINKFI